MNLNDNISLINGVGADRERRLNSLGIFTVYDLISYYPRDHEDRSRAVNVGEAAAGRTNTLRGFVVNKPRLSYANGLKLVKAKISGGGYEIEAIWFNQPYLVSYFKPGIEYFFTGKVAERLGRLQIENPEFEPFSEDSLNNGRIIPVYRLTSGLTQKLLRKLIGSVMDECLPLADEYLHEKILRDFSLCSRRDAILNIHFPVSNAAFYSARERLVFDELLITQLALARIKGTIKIESGIKITDISTQDIENRLGFSLTNAQSRVLDEIKRDLSGETVMARLIQGDVGSGKTAVAMMAAYIAVNNGYQAVVMAPTEVLAKQHYGAFSRVFDDICITFLSGSLTKKEKKSAYDDIVSFRSKIIIGTHALIEEAVEYARLGLVITDEQHRFGVRQRIKLSEKGKGTNPHTLVMSATPIPRSLALTLYGDLDISVIDELPPGRKDIDTFAVNSEMRPRILSFIKKEAEKGRQAYIICPAIDDDEDSENELRAVVSHAESIKKFLPGLNVNILHGRMSGKEKNDVMEEFSSGNIQVLVSTTVIEVGVNVPNATVMFIENAERFGLSQLHQLRGRVGRGGNKSYCILLSDSKSKQTAERLEVMKETNDGFKIAEKDLELRGAGDFFGTRQSGLAEFKIANLYEDMKILAMAQSAVRELCGSGGQARLHDGIEKEINTYLKSRPGISI